MSMDGEDDEESVSGSQPLFASQVQEDPAELYLHVQTEEGKDKVVEAEKIHKVRRRQRAENPKHIPLCRSYRNDLEKNVHMPVKAYLQVFDLYRRQLMLSQSKLKNVRMWGDGIGTGTDEESCESGTLLLKQRPRGGNISHINAKGDLSRRPGLRGTVAPQSNSSTIDETDDSDFAHSQTRRLRTAKTKTNSCDDDDAVDFSDDGKQGIGSKVKGWLSAKKRKVNLQDENGDNYSCNKEESQRKTRKTKINANKRIRSDSDDDVLVDIEESGEEGIEEITKGPTIKRHQIEINNTNDETFSENGKAEKYTKNTSIFGGFKSGLNKVIGGFIGKRKHRERPESTDDDIPTYCHKNGIQEASSRKSMAARSEEADVIITDIEDSDNEEDKMPPFTTNYQTSSMPRKTSSKSLVECPICMQNFPSTDIENHAATCDGEVVKRTTRSQASESQERVDECVPDYISLNQSFSRTKVGQRVEQGSAKAKVFSAWSAACERINSTESTTTLNELKAKVSSEWNSARGSNVSTKSNATTSENHTNKPANQQLQQPKWMDKNRIFGRAIEEVAKDSMHIYKEEELKNDAKKTTIVNGSHESDKKSGGGKQEKELNQAKRYDDHRKPSEALLNKDNGKTGISTQTDVTFKEKSKQWMSDDDSEDADNDPDDSMSFLDQYIPADQIRKNKKRKSDKKTETSRKQQRRKYLDEEDSIDANNELEKCFLCGKFFPAGLEYQRHVEEEAEALEAENDQPDVNVLSDQPKPRDVLSDQSKPRDQGQQYNSLANKENSPATLSKCLGNRKSWIRYNNVEAENADVSNDSSGSDIDSDDISKSPVKSFKPVSSASNFDFDNQFTLNKTDRSKLGKAKGRKRYPRKSRKKQ